MKIFLKRYSKWRIGTLKNSGTWLKNSSQRRTNVLSDSIDPEIWYDWFKKFNNVSDTLSDDTYMPIIRNLRDFVPQFVKMLDKLIDVDEIKKAAFKLKNGKSLGIDLISHEMIKCCVDSHFVRLIRELFNFILVEFKVPTCWKQGLLTPVFKSGEIYNSGDYGGITNTSRLSKLFMLIVTERLVSFIDSKAILMPSKIGFRRKFRTSDQMFVPNVLLIPILPMKNQFTQKHMTHFGEMDL